MLRLFKKSICLILCLFTLFTATAFVACDKNNNSTNSSTTPGTSGPGGNVGSGNIPVAVIPTQNTTPNDGYTMATASAQFTTGSSSEVQAMKSKVQEEINARQNFTFTYLTSYMTPRVREMFEVNFDISATFETKYINSPYTVEINAYISEPNNDTLIKVPCFYKQFSNPKFAFRYNPDTVGLHYFYLKDEKTGVCSEVFNFAVEDTTIAENRGKIKVNGNKFYDADNKVITLRGANMTSGYTVSDYQAAAPIFNANGVNYIRFWAWDWHSTYRLEQAYSLGRYSASAADSIDKVLSAMEDNNVYVMFTLFNIWEFQDIHWAKNAYNTANGGMCTWSSNNTDWWTDALAVKYEAQLVRYVASRYSAYTSFAMMEYWNECDNQTLPSGEGENSLLTVINWHNTMHQVYEQNDIYGTSESTSFAWMDHASQNKNLWQRLTFLDVVKRHRYTNDGISDWMTQFNSVNDGRAFVMSEFGPADIDQSYYSFNNYRDNLALEGIWAPIFFGNTASSNLYWFNGDKFYNDADYMKYYLIQDTFMGDMEDKMAYMNHTYRVNGNMQEGYFSNSNSVMIYATSNSNSVNTGKTFTLTNMTNGTYNVGYFEPLTGNYNYNEVTVSNGTLTLTPGSFTRCIAIKAYLI